MIEYLFNRMGVALVLKDKPDLEARVAISTNDESHLFSGNPVLEEAYSVYGKDLLNRLYMYALKLTRNKHDAEDLFQDTLLRVCRFPHKYEQGTNVRAWLCRILINTYINEYRKKQKGPKEIPFDYPITSEPNLVNSSNDDGNPETSLIVSELPEYLSRIIEKLPIKYKMAVVLSMVDNFSYREIAKILNCPVGTVMSRLHRGRGLIEEGIAAIIAEKTGSPVEQVKEELHRLGYRGINGKYGCILYEAHKTEHRVN